MKRVYKFEQRWGGYESGNVYICASGYADFMNINDFRDRPYALEVHVSDKPVKGAFPVELSGPYSFNNTIICGERTYISQTTREAIYDDFGLDRRRYSSNTRLKLWVWVYES